MTSVKRRPPALVSVNVMCSSGFLHHGLEFQLVAILCTTEFRAPDRGTPSDKLHFCISIDPCHLQIRATFDSFTEFYTHQHNGRKLTWLHQHSKGDLQTLYTKPKYILNVRDGVLSPECSLSTMMFTGVHVSDGRSPPV